MMPLINIGYTSEEYKMHESSFLLSLTERVSPYIFELPARAGHSPVLDGAVKCVAAALRWHSSSADPPEQDLPTALLILYGQVVQMLRRTLEDPERSRDAEVLCATQLMCIFEVSDAENLARPRL